MVRNMYANRVARGGGSTFSRGKERKSDMAAALGFKRSCNYFNNPGHKKTQCFKFLRESDRGSLPSSRPARNSWYSLHNTDLHDNANCLAQQQQRGNGGGGGYSRSSNNRGNGNRRRHGGGSNTGRANTAVTANGTSLSKVSTPAPAATAAPATAPPASVTFQAAPTSFNAIESLPSGIGYSFLAGSSILGPLKFTMTTDCATLSHFVDSDLIGDIESRVKNIVKPDPLVTIIVAGHSMLSGGSIDTLTARVTDAQGFLPDMLLPAMNVPGLDWHFVFTLVRSRYLYAKTPTALQ